MEEGRKTREDRRNLGDRKKMHREVETDRHANTYTER